MAVGSGPVVKAWAEGVPMEPDVWKQVNNLSAVPGVERIAIMPDAHIGNGACVGSAILTRDIVIPAAVGVDIGCFDGDTRVPLLDGSQRCLRELAMSQDAFWVYSVNGSGRIAPGKAVARLTRTNAPLMCVVVSGGDEIVCTPDHQFMLSDGSYREAQALQFNDSLMPLMTAAAHSQHHRHAGRKLDDSDPAFQQARLAGLRRSTADPALQAQRAQIGTRNITAYMRDRPEHFAEVVAANGKRGAAVLDAFNVSPRMCNDCGEQLRNPAALRWHKHREHSFNHKVLSVTPLQRRADVYCLQVEEHHNFALAAGVFVHNCGMIAAPLGLRRSDLSDLQRVRAEIEERVPVGRTDNGQRGDRGAWGTPPQDVLAVWKTVLERDYTAMVKKHPQLEHQFVTNHLGTMGTGNHFLEVCIELDPGDDDPRLWLMLHSGSRGVGNKIGSWFTRQARAETKRAGIQLPDMELGFLKRGTALFEDYLTYAQWAQGYAWQSRLLMFRRALDGIAVSLGERKVEYDQARLTHCHHNYVAEEEHFGGPGLLTRKGAVNADKGVMGIIPGSMGARSYITRGKGNPEALRTSSHGAGRVMSRGAARRSITMEEHLKALAGVECRTDPEVIDESPAAYKPIDAVMEAQRELTEAVVALKQIVVVKG